MTGVFSKEISVLGPGEFHRGVQGLSTAFKNTAGGAGNSDEVRWRRVPVTFLLAPVVTSDRSSKSTLSYKKKSGENFPANA